MNSEEVHWYYIDDNNNDAQVGPFVLKDFKEKFLSGLITPESYCWHEELEDWEKLKNILFRGKPALYYITETAPIQKSDPPKNTKNSSSEIKSSDIEEEIRERLRRKFGK